METIKKKEKLNVTIPLDSGFSHILFNLAAQGYSDLCIIYDGSGDDGSIENIIPIPRDLEILIGHDSCYEIENPIELDEDLYKLIENQAYRKVLDHLEDWCNNDGGYGQLYISTENSSYDSYHYTRYTDINAHPSDGQIED
jgi:hypothetical protein